MAKGKGVRKGVIDIDWDIVFAEAKEKVIAEGGEEKIVGGSDG